MSSQNESKLQILKYPRLYISYPLWQYANGNLDYYTGYVNTAWGNISDEDMIKVINLDPNDNIRLDWTAGSTCSFNYGVLPKMTIEYDMPRNLWNFNYAMVLNHNFASGNVRSYVRQDNLDSNSTTTMNIPYTELVNNNAAGCEFNGWSLIELNQGPHNLTDNVFRFGLWNPNGIPPSQEFYFQSNPMTGEPILDNTIDIGTLMWGKYYDFPSNIQIESNSLSYTYGSKSQKTMGGKSINQKEWVKKRGWDNSTHDFYVPDWDISVPGWISESGTEAFGLRGDVNQGNDEAEDANSIFRASGKRNWDISFTAVSESDLMPQNPMMNSLGWDSTFDNLDSFDDTAGTSVYNIDDGIDFYTDVVHKTNGGQLPMVLQINKLDKSPQNFAIVKMTDYQINQIGPMSYNVKLKLMEQ